MFQPGEIIYLDPKPFMAQARKQCGGGRAEVRQMALMLAWYKREAEEKAKDAVYWEAEGALWNCS